MSKKIDPMDALRRAAERSGGVGKLADRLGIAPHTVSTWFLRRAVPLEPAVRIARLGLGVALHELRPDYFDPPAAERIERRSGADRRRSERRRVSQR